MFRTMLAEVVRRSANQQGSASPLYSFIVMKNSKMKMKRQGTIVRSQPKLETNAPQTSLQRQLPTVQMQLVVLSARNESP